MPMAGFAAAGFAPMAVPAVIAGLAVTRGRSPVPGRLVTAGIGRGALAAGLTALFTARTGFGLIMAGWDFAGLFAAAPVRPAPVRPAPGRLAPVREVAGFMAGRAGPGVTRRDRLAAGFVAAARVPVARAEPARLPEARIALVRAALPVRAPLTVRAVVRGRAAAGLAAAGRRATGLAAPER